jgi:hypothetical protein
MIFFFARGRWKPQPDRWLARRWDTLESSEMYQHAEIHLINVSGVAAGNALGTVTGQSADAAEQLPIATA